MYNLKMKLIMKTNDNKSIPEKPVEDFFEQIRTTYSGMLKEYLRIYKKYDQLKTSVCNENTGKYYDLDGVSYFDENGKINWEIIRRFLPQDMEKRIKNKYSMLNDNEIRLCCLHFFKVSKKTISNILSYKQKTIKSANFRIRQKTGIENIQEIFKIITGYFS